MNITFMLSPITVLSRYPVASRVLTSNLLNEDRLNVEFFQVGLQSFAKGARIYKDQILPKIEKNPSMRSEFIKWWSGNEAFGRFPMAYVFAGNMDDEIIDKIKTEYVMFSAATIMDYNFIKSLINRNKKVIVGGSSTLIYTTNELRRILIESGADETKTNKNLIIVSGYVDMKTDLYKIIIDWKDHVIVDNDFNTIWDARKDFMLNYSSIMNTLYHTTINILLNSKCWWGKCRFCTHKYLPCIDFDKDMDVDKIVDYIDEISSLYKTDGIFFNDSYIVDTPKIKKLFKILGKKYKIDIYTGINLLRKPSYIKFINESNIQKLYIGMETTNDFSLNYINKGYNRFDIMNAVELMAKDLNHSTYTSFFNMIDIPVGKEKEIHENWETLLQIRRKFQDHGSNCYYNFAMLRNYPKTDMVDNKLLKYATEDQMNSENLIGIWNIYKFFEELGVDISGISKSITKPVVRYLPSGKQLKSDLYITDIDIMKEITIGGNK